MLRDMLLFRQPCRRLLLKLSRRLPERYRYWLLDELYPDWLVVHIGADKLDAMYARANEGREEG